MKLIFFFLIFPLLGAIIFLLWELCWEFSYYSPSLGRYYFPSFVGSYYFSSVEGSYYFSSFAGGIIFFLCGVLLFFFLCGSYYFLPLGSYYFLPLWGAIIFFLCGELIFSSFVGSYYKLIFTFFFNIDIGRSKYPCCYSNDLSIFFGGSSSQSLYGVKANIVDVWLRNSTSLKFYHIRKDDNWK